MKIIKHIITFLSFFSIVNTINAYEEWIIVNTLNLRYWVEEIKIDFEKIWNYKIIDNNLNKEYLKIKKMMPIFQDMIIEKYKNWEYSYYKTNAIIKSYNNFIYHTDKYFYYISINEKTPNNIEINWAIYKNLKLSRSYYDMMVNYIRKK